MDTEKLNSIFTPSPLFLHTLKLLQDKNDHSPRSKYKVQVLRSIYQNSGITRKELIAQLGIRAGTISDIVQALVSDQLIIESSVTDQRERGRPEIPLSINSDRWYAVSVFCISMNLHAVLIDSSDQHIAKTSIRVPASSDNSDIENAIVLLIKQLLTEKKYSQNLLGVSLSVPGIVNSIEKEWIFSARWPRLRNLSLNNIQDKLGMSIHIRRQLDVQLECNMIKDPEYMKGNVLLFHWGYGIGGAFASGGSIIGSSTGVFCQIGHVSVDPDSIKPCICGRLGCLEADAALWALAPEIERTHGQKLEDEVDCINFLATHSFADESYFRQALTSVVHALCRLLAILVPDTVLMYGAFLENEEIFNSLVLKTKQLSPPFIAEKTQFKRISTDSSWDPRGITAPLFYKAYSEHLI